MRRSTQVFAPLLASAAVALLAGCRSPDMQRCVDENNQVVDPSFCKSLPQGTQSAVGTVGNRGGYYGSNGLFIPHVYRYYYGGGGGSTVVGGSFAPVSGHSYSVSNGTVRGGFGSSFSSHDGGGSGEGSGGHGGGAGE